MLGKLLKYEIKATQRIFLPLFGLIIIFTLINKAFLTFNFNLMEGMAIVPFVITMIAYCVLIAATFVMTLIVSIQRFQKNLLNDEGYLSFTLPVKTHSHIDSKMIITLMWTVLSLIVAVLSVFVLAINKSNVREFSRFCMEVGKTFQTYGAQAYGILIELIVLLIVATLCETLQIYASIVVGNLSSKHKLLAGIGAYMGFGVIEQIVISIIFNAAFNGNKFDMLEDIIPPIQILASGLGAMIIYFVVFGAAFYFFTNWMLSKKLNLE